MGWDSRGEMKEKAIRDNAGQPRPFAPLSTPPLVAECPPAQLHDHRREKRKSLAAAWQGKTPPV